MRRFITNPINQIRLDTLTDYLPQSLLITGERGVGLLTTARHIADKQLAAITRPQDAKEHDDSNGTITVQMIRRLYDQTRSKHTTRTILIIDDADRMSLSAQAAFLKLLEEPNANTYFILTSHTPGQLLPTIRSRVQQITLQPATDEQTTAFINSLGVSDTTKQAQLRFIAAGLPAEIMRLVGDDAYFGQRAKIMTDAHKFLQSKPYDQLLITQRYHADRSAALSLVDSMILVARRSLSAKPQSALITQLDKLLSIRSNLQANHSVRLQLIRFMV